MIRYSNPDLGINPDLDPAIVKENRPVTVGEMLIKLLKMSYFAMVREMEK